MTEPKHVSIARRDIGLSEVKGPENSPRIVEMLTKLGAWWKEDETPWCGVALASWMKEAGLPYPRAYFRALSWLDYGEASASYYGSVAVLTRKGGGHVGLVTGITDDAQFIRLLGGNQGDKVCEAWFPVERVAEFRMPAGVAKTSAPVAQRGQLSKVES